MNKIEYTNFEGNWEDTCPFCGHPQKEHQVNLGEYEGVTYIHRQPCEEENYQKTKKAVRQSIAIRTIINIYDFCKYLYGKIPFRSEIILVFGFLKNIFKSIKALIFLKIKR